jgi:hypothetical protein
VGRRKCPLESAPATNQLSNICCASPGAEEATRRWLASVVMLFRSTLLHPYRHSRPRFSGKQICFEAASPITGFWPHPGRTPRPICSADLRSMNFAWSRLGRGTLRGILSAGYLLDTNVVSETRKTGADRGVLSFLSIFADCLRLSLSHKSSGTATGLRQRTHFNPPVKVRYLSLLSVIEITTNGC